MRNESFFAPLKRFLPEFEAVEDFRPAIVCFHTHEPSTARRGFSDFLRVSFPKNSEASERALAVSVRVYVYYCMSLRHL